MADTIKIPGELESVATGNKVADVANIKDKTKGNKTQFQINAEVEEAIGADNIPGSIKGRIKENETALAENGSVDQRIAEESAKHYLKAETYNKTELNSMITTPSTAYKPFEATEETTDVTDVLPAAGEANTIYSVGSWDGTQYSEVDYTEYAWNGSAYVKLSTKSQIGAVYDISAKHADAKYADLAAALNGGANIPQSLQKGGMSVKFVQSSNNNYVKFFCTAQNFTTDVTKWQGVDNEPTAGSDNLVKSGGVYGSTPSIDNTTEDIDFSIDDEEDNMILLMKNGHIKTQKFDSEKNGQTEIGTSENDFEISDEKNYPLCVFNNGHIKTQKFDSDKIPTSKIITENGLNILVI